MTAQKSWVERKGASERELRKKKKLLYGERLKMDQTKRIKVQGGEGNALERFAMYGRRRVRQVSNQAYKRGVSAVH